MAKRKAAKRKIKAKIKAKAKPKIKIKPKGLDEPAGKDQLQVSWQEFTDAVTRLHGGMMPTATVILEAIRDLEMKLAAVDPQRRRWPMALFQYGAHVKLKPVDNVAARVIDLHVLGQAHTIEYDVRYFHDGREMKIRVFEDELEAIAPASPPHRP